MSIFFDIVVGPKGRRLRRAVQEDKYEIELLFKNNESEKLFGEVDIGSLIELTTLSICMINVKQEVIGFMSVCDHPAIPGVDPAAWETWMRNMYQKFYLSRNTLFIHAMCCAETAFDYFLEEALVSLFKNDVYLQQIVLMVPPDCPKEFILKYQTIRKYNYKRNKARREDDYDANYHYFYTALRHDFCPKLRIRRAVEEDNDDIVAILDKNCPRLRELYGDFYISEIIGQHPEMKRKIIVSEGIDRVTGVMCLNSDVNFSMLQNTYELDSYHGLCKVTPLEKEKNKRSNILLRAFGDPIMLGKWSPFDVTPFIEHEKTPDDQSNDNESLKVKSSSKVNFSRDSHYNIDLQTSAELSDKLSPIVSQRTSFVHFLLEEDPFDYEIVNIDHNLLRIPMISSKDVLLSNAKKRSPRRSIVTEMDNKYRRRSSIRIDRNEVKKKCTGEPNAFMIELFGFNQDIDESHAFDLLEASFEVMKDYDYCIIRKPCSEKSFPLLQHFAFVPTKNKLDCEYALYIAHRCSVLSRLRVRRAEIIDIPQIAQLLYSLDGRETLWSVENTIFRRNELEAYVFLSNVSVVGIGILEPPDQIDFLRSKFNLDEYRTHSHHVSGQDQGAGCATLNTALVYPAFEPHYRFFVRDMLRLSGIHSLVWMTAYRNKWVTHKINSLAAVMIPLRPRIFHLDYATLPKLDRLQALSNSLSFSCWYIGARMCSIPKVTVDCRLVVVGASTTAMAFLDTLLFGDTSPYIFFTNLTLISPNGLPYARKSNTLAQMMLLKDHTNSDKYLKSVPYTYYVNTVLGSVVEIEKRQKYVLLSNSSRYYYDRLFLLCGKQYQRPDYLKDLHKRDRSDMKYSRLDVPRCLKMPYVSSSVPTNVFIVNNITDAKKSLNYLRSIDWEETEGRILVYGATIHAYCCLATLLEMKISPELIVFIEPFPDECEGSRVSAFCNIYVDKTMREVLENLNIKVYRSYYFQNWSLDADNVVTHVQIMSHFELLSLECAALFYYGKRGVNEELFMAVHRAGMGYSGGLLVDHQFKSRTPCVYAAGPLVHHRYSYHNSYEIGVYLGTLIRNELDPLFTEQTKCHNNKTDTGNVEEKESNGRVVDDTEQETPLKSIPEFKKPFVQYCYLPGGLQYLEVRSPGLKVPHHYVHTLEFNGFVIETFKTGYFKLHFNKDLIVDGITCLTPAKYSLENFKKIYGLSSSILNNVHLRYTTKRLDNLFEFFREPWAHFLYHDHIEELFGIVKELLPKDQPHGETIKEVVKTAVDKLPMTALSYDMKLKIRSSFEKSPHIEAITQYVIQWVSENNILLPMYLQPTERSAYAHDLEKHPAFKRRKRSLVKMLAKIC